MRKQFAKSIILTLLLLCSAPIITGMTTLNKVNEAVHSNVENVQSYTFVLTHLLGKKLTQKAHFTVGNISTWTLDMRNGSKIRYTITGRVGSDPMCGITAKDNFGDVCAICIEKKSGDSVEVEIRYSAGTFTYTGYLLR